MATTHPTGNFLRGVLMGMADLVPGVSGGTVALLTGIYERLVRAVRSLTGLPLALLMLDAGRARKHARQTDWLLVVPVLAGMAAAIVAGASVIPGLIEDHPELMYGLFFGLIVGSLPTPWRQVGGIGPRQLVTMGIAALAAFLLVGISGGAQLDPALPVVFLAAMVAICAMVLPGISGSFLLLVMGVYEATLTAVSDRNLTYVGVFALGALTGLTLFSRVLSWLLDRYHAATMAAVTGLLVGSLRALWPWRSDEGAALQAPSGTAAEVALVVAVMVGGALVAALVARYGSRLAPRDR